MQSKKLKKPLSLKIGKKTVTITEIRFPSNKKSKAYSALIDDFVFRVFGYRDCLVSDLSSIYDFDFTLDFEKRKVKHNTEKCLKKIKRIYGVDVSDVKGLILVDVIKKIASEQKKAAVTRITDRSKSLK